MNWEDCFSENKEIIFVTASKSGEPNANIVVSLGIVDDKVLISNCQMVKTINNINKNPIACIIGGYYRIRGRVEVLSSGKYFDICLNRNKGYNVKNALLISIDEVLDLDKQELIK